jgi:hypothetical protein
MNELHVGYARVSTEQQDLTAQCDGLRAVGVGDDRVLERDAGGKGEGPAPWQQPKLKPNKAKHLLELHDLGTYSQLELAELFGAGRLSTSGRVPA